jgi:prefoldin subunit 5
LRTRLIRFSSHAQTTNEEDDMNIDSSAFTVDKYVGTMLQYKSLEELVHRGNAMVSEIKSLDSDMQMLVYENYNKFISATDTIRKMKHRVEDMESQMIELEKNMGTISSASESVDSSLSARDIGKVAVAGVSTHVIPAGSDEHLAQSMAPFIYARPDTVGRDAGRPH